MNGPGGDEFNDGGIYEEIEKYKLELELEGDSGAQNDLAGRDDGDDDWGLPANYASLNLEAEPDQRPVWDLVKRFWKPKECQKSKRQLAAEKKSKTLQAQREGRAAAGKKPETDEEGELDTDEDGDEEEPSTSDVEGKFQYCWRLSAPEPYERAGAVGKRWIPVRFDENADSLKKLNQGKLHWIVAARWWVQCKTVRERVVGKIAIYDKDFVNTGKTFAHLKMCDT